MILINLKSAEIKSGIVLLKVIEYGGHILRRAAQSLSNRLVELAEIKPGQRILDIATGIGEPALTAARIVGSIGHVLAIDISTEMIAIAKQRGAFNGLQNTIEYRETEAEDLVLPDLSFDAALCRWGLMFLPNLNATLTKIHRSLVSGGRFIAAVWADEHNVPVISLGMEIISEYVQMAAFRLRLVSQIHIVLLTQIDLQIIYLKQDLEIFESRQ